MSGDVFYTFLMWYRSYLIDDSLKTLFMNWAMIYAHMPIKLFKRILINANEINKHSWFECQVLYLVHVQPIVIHVGHCFFHVDMKWRSFNIMFGRLYVVQAVVDIFFKSLYIPGPLFWPMSKSFVPRSKSFRRPFVGSDGGSFGTEEVLVYACFHK